MRRPPLRAALLPPAFAAAFVYVLFSLAATEGSAKDASDGGGSVVERIDERNLGGFQSTIPWSSSVRINDDTVIDVQQMPSLAIGADGSTYAVWEDNRNRNSRGMDIYFARRDPTTGVWSANERVNDDTTTRRQQEPAVAVDAAGNVYAVWSDERNGSKCCDFDIYFSKRSASTGSWSANVRVNDDTQRGSQTTPRIALAPSGEAIAVWLDGRHAKPTVYSSRLAAGASTWDPNKLVSSNTQSQKNFPDVAFGPDGTAHAVWADDRTGVMRVFFATLAPGSSTWSTNVQISGDYSHPFPTYGDVQPRIGSDGQGALLASWIDEGNIPNRVRARSRRPGSATWEPSQLVSDPSTYLVGGQYFPLLAMSVQADGRAFIAWKDSRAPIGQIRGAQFDPFGNVWSAVEMVGDDPATADQGEPAVAIRGNVVGAAWKDLRGDVGGQSRGDVLFRRFTGLAREPAPPGTDRNRPLIHGATSGLSVSSGNGAFTLSHVDVSIAGRGPSPIFARTYNSNDTRVTPLGPGWTFSYNAHIADAEDGTGAVILVGAQGRSDRYAFTAGAYTAPVGVYVTLVRNADFTYVATLQDQSLWLFDAAGRLSAVADRYGNRSTLAYNGAGQLSTISDPAGRGSLTLSYNATGRLSAVSDWLSPARTVQFGYDASNRLETVTDRAGGITRYGYESTGRLSHITDPLSHVSLVNTYDAQGRVATQKDARGALTGAETTLTYTSNPDGTSTVLTTYPTTSFDINWRGRVTDTFDARGFLISRTTQGTASESATVQFGYNVNGNRISATDARGKVTLYCYDVGYAGNLLANRGNLTRVISPAPLAGANPLVSLTAYDDKNNVTQAVPPQGVNNGAVVGCATDLSAMINTMFATDTIYDASRTLLLAVTRRATDPDLGARTAVQKFEYGDPANPGRVTRMITPRGNIGPTPDYGYATTSTYYSSGSQAGMLQSLSDALGNTSTFTYDVVGRRLTRVDPNGNAQGANPSHHEWQWSYDSEDRVRFERAPAPAPGGTILAIESRYDAAGNPIVTVDANGQVVRKFFNERNQLSELHESPLAWTDPNIAPAVIVRTTYGYDNLGHLTRLTRAAGDAAVERVVDYLYDGANRLRKEIQYPSWPATTPALVTTTTHDANGNVATLTDPLGQTTTFAYDDLNRNASTSFSDGLTQGVSFTWDRNGNRSSMADGYGTRTFTYDEANQLIATTSPGAVTVGYRYDLDGNRTKLIYPDGTAATYVSDRAGRLSALTDWASRTTSYEYTSAGMPLSVAAINGTSTTFDYDNAVRLTQLRHVRGPDVVSEFSYVVDAIGNRTRVDEVQGQVSGPPVATSTLYTYDRMSRLTADAAVTLTYDLAGNRATTTRNGTTTTYSYDRADRLFSVDGESYVVNANGNLVARGADGFTFDQVNRLIGATVAGSTTQYAYDGLGNRASKTVGGLTTSFVHDLNRSDALLLDDGNRKYVWGNGLAYSEDRSGATVVYHGDGINSVRAITDAAGAVVQTYTREAFGSRTAAQGAIAQPIDFTGEVRDAESGLIFLRSRLYDPSTGRFISRDSFGGFTGRSDSLNRYTYAGNNPVNRTDPSGRAFIAGDAGGGCSDPACSSSPEPVIAYDTAPDSTPASSDPAAPITLTCDLCGLVFSAMPGAPVLDFVWTSVPDYAKPDYVKADVDVGWLAWGPSANVVVDRYGHLYVQPFTGGHAVVGTPGLGGSITAGYLVQASVPSAQEVNDFVSAWTFSGGGGWVAGVQSTYSPSTDKTAIEIGLFTPSFGFSGGYSEPVRELRLPGW